MNKGELLLYDNQLIVVNDDRGVEDLIFVKNQNAYYALHSMKAKEVSDTYLGRLKFIRIGEMKVKSLRLLKKVISTYEKKKELEKLIEIENEKLERCRRDYKDSFKKVKKEKAIEIIEEALENVVNKYAAFSNVDFYFSGFEGNQISRIYATVSYYGIIPGRMEKYNSEHNCKYLYREYDGSLRIDRGQPEYKDDLDKVVNIMNKFASKTKKSSMFDIQERHNIAVTEKGSFIMEKEVLFSLDAPLELTESNLKQVMKYIVKSYNFKVGRKKLNFSELY